MWTRESAEMQLKDLRDKIIEKYRLRVYSKFAIEDSKLDFEISFTSKHWSNETIFTFKLKDIDYTEELADKYYDLIMQSFEKWYYQRIHRYNVNEYLEGGGTLGYPNRKKNIFSKSVSIINEVEEQS